MKRKRALAGPVYYFFAAGAGFKNMSVVEPSFSKTSSLSPFHLKTPSELYGALEELSKDMPLYIDSALGGGVKGEEKPRSCGKKNSPT